MPDNARDNQRDDKLEDLRSALMAAIDSTNASNRLMAFVLKKLDQSQVEAGTSEQKNWLQKIGLAKSDDAKIISGLEESLKDKAEEIALLRNELGLLEKEKTSSDESERELKADNARLEEDLAEARRELANTRAEVVRIKAELEARIESLESDLAAASKRENELAANIGRINEEAEKIKAELSTWRDKYNALSEETDGLKRDLAASRDEYTRLSEIALPELEELVHILRSAPRGFIDKIRLYYNIDDPLVFLSQCGKKARIEQLWKMCSDAVYDGQDPENLADFLKLLVARHNLANPSDPLMIDTPEPASRYNYYAQDRVGSDGEKIDSVLLPGLTHKNGLIAKALVRLSR